MTTEAFLSLFPGDHTFQTFDDNEERKDKRLAKFTNRPFEDCGERLKAFNSRGAGVFFVVNETDGKGRKARNVVKVRAVFVDLDGPEARTNLSKVLESHLPPSVVVESSPGKFHCYWLVFNCPLEKFAAVQTALASKFGGDPIVRDLCRVMRLPGFYHCKDAGNKFLTRVVHDVIPAEEVGKVFSLDEIVSCLDIDLSADSKPTTTNSRRVPEIVTDSGLAGFKKGERNQGLFRYACSLRGRRMEAAEIGLLVHQAAAACDPPVPTEEAAVIVAQACKYPPGRAREVALELAEFGPSPASGEQEEAETFEEDKKNPRKFSARIFPATELACAHAFVKEFGEKVRYTDEGSLHWFSTDRWIEDVEGGRVAEGIASIAVDYEKRARDIDKKNTSGNEQLVKRAHELRSFAKSLSSAKRQSAVIRLVKNDPKIHCRRDSFDANPGILNCPNGVVDLETGKIHPHDPKLLCGKMAAVAYKPEAAYKTDAAIRLAKMLAHMADGKPGWVENIQRALGYSLTGYTKEKCCFFLWGVKDSGKSTLINLFMKALGGAENQGNSYSSTFSIDLFNDVGKGRNDYFYRIARLCGLRSIFSSEIKSTSTLDGSLIKDVTGNDPLSGRFPAGREFVFTPQFKLWIRGNCPPKISGMDEGVQVRLRVVDCTRSFVPEGLPDDQLKAVRLQGSEIENSTEMQEAMLAFAVEGAMSWHKSGLAEYQSDDMEEIKEFYAAAMQTNVVKSFVSSMILVSGDSSHILTAPELWNSFKAYALAQSLPKGGMGEFLMSFKKEMDAEPLCRRSKLQGRNVYRGITFKIGFEEDPTSDDDNNDGPM